VRGGSVGIRRFRSFRSAAVVAMKCPDGGLGLGQGVGVMVGERGGRVIGRFVAMKCPDGGLGLGQGEGVLGGGTGWSGGRAFCGD
jgi:hypothetical protein